eukprot:g647.t1
MPVVSPYNVKGDTRSLYEIIGVQKHATPNAIRKAYKKAMLRTHPDKAKSRGGSPSAFIAVQKAYKVLSDPSKRRIYDAQFGGTSKFSFRRSTAEVKFRSYDARGKKREAGFKNGRSRTGNGESRANKDKGHVPFVGSRIAILLNGSWVKGFLKAYDTRSQKSTILCDTGVLHKCILRERTYQLLDYYDRPCGKVHYSTKKRDDFGVFWPWAKNKKNKKETSRTKESAASAKRANARGADARGTKDRHLKWYYLDSQKRKRGPLSTSAIQQLLKSEFIKIDSYVWNQQMSEWKRASQISTLNEVILRNDRGRRKGSAYGAEDRNASRRAAKRAAAQRMYYYLDSKRRQRGPVASATLCALFKSGALRSRSYVWRKGFSKWLPLDEVTELSHALLGAEGESTESEAKTSEKTSTSKEPTVAAIKLARKIAAFKRFEKAKAEREAEATKAREKRREQWQRAVSRAKMASRRASTVAVTVATASATHAVAMAANAKAAVCAAILKRTSAAGESKRSRSSVSFTDMLQPPSAVRRDRRTQQKRDYVGHGIWRVVEENADKGTWLKPEVRSPAVEVKPAEREGSDASRRRSRGRAWSERGRDNSEEKKAPPSKNMSPNNVRRSSVPSARSDDGVRKAEKWYYVDGRGSQRGPLSRSILLGLIDAKCLGPATYVWSSSVNGAAMKKWKRVRDVASLNSRNVRAREATMRASEPRKETSRAGRERSRTSSSSSKSNHRSSDARSDAEWFYLDSSRKRQGPITRAEIKSMLDNGGLDARAYVWKAPMASWKRASDVFHKLKRNLRRASAAPSRSANDRASRENVDPAKEESERTVRWFCLNKKKQCGPLSLHDLLKLPYLKRNSLVWRKGMQNWKTADSVPAVASRMRESREDGRTAVEKLTEIFENAMRSAHRRVY